MNKKVDLPIFPVWPKYEQDEIEAVVQVLQSGKTNLWVGEQVKLFEKEFANFIGSPYGIAVCNGTLALELALYALDIGSGDDVVVPCKSFVATASSVLMRGATPIFADVNLESQNITVDSIKSVITSKTKAIIVVHLAGWPCEMESICEFAEQRNLKIIEDCAQAHGAQYKGKYVGSFGDAATFSFCHDKIMTMGEGGILLLNNEAAWQRAWAYKDHGKDYEAMQNGEQSSAFRWVHNSIGTNWRLTEMQAAIGRRQLKKLPQWLSKRKNNAESLIHEVNTIPGLHVLEPPEYIEHAYYRCYFLVEIDMLKPEWSRDKLIEALRAEGVPCMEGSCSEIYREKIFIEYELIPEDRLPTAKKLSDRSICFLVHPTMTEKDMKMISDTTRSVLTTAIKDIK